MSTTMPVALEKSVEIRTHLVTTINGDGAIDEFTARKIKHEIEKEKSYHSRLMLNSLLDVALKKYSDAYDSFELYVKHCNSFEAYSDYLTFLTQVNDYVKAHDISKYMHGRFGRDFGATHLKQLYDVFRAVSDLQMMKIVCDDLEAIHSEVSQSTKLDAESFIEHCEDFCQLASTNDNELSKVLLVAYDVVKDFKVYKEARFALDVGQVLYYRLTSEGECGVAMTIKGIPSDCSVSLVSDMNLMLVDKLMAQDAFPQGCWSLWFEPIKK